MSSSSSSSLFVKIIGALKRHPVDKFSLLIALQLCTFYPKFKRQFEQTSAAFESIGSIGSSDGNNRKQLSRWDWGRFPRLPSSYELTEHLIDFYMLYVGLKLFCPQLLQAFVALLPLHLPPNCYLMGNLIFHEYLEHQLSILFLSFHVLWHLYHYFNTRNYSMNACIFLLLTDQDLQQSLTALRQSACALPVATSGSIVKVKQQQQQEKLSDAFRQVLAYPVRLSDSCVYYRVRPNRTLASRHELQHQNALMTFIVAGAFTLLCALLIPLFLIRLLDDKRYLRKYPGCDANLSERFRLGLIADGQVSFNRWHQLISFVCDMLENTLLWSAPGLSLLTAWSTAYLLNYDLLIYWRHLDIKLNHLTAQVRGVNRNRKSLKRDSELALAVYELQVEFFDFFHQFGQLDVVITICTSVAIATWLTFFVTLGHHSLNFYELYASFELPILVLALALFHFICITSGSLGLLSTHASCLKSYRTICTLMAYDQSCHKLRFTHLLDFYTVRNRAVYTIFGQIAYTKATYLSIFSWTLSGFSIFESFIRRR